jgi:thiosulfate dehydrogenase
MAEQVRGATGSSPTRTEAARFTGGKVRCSNCHLNAGQRERALALVGVAGMFPEYNNRAARLISLPDRIVDCFLRSENGTARPEELPTTSSKEVLARRVVHHLAGQGLRRRQNPAWRNRTRSPPTR